MGAGSAPPTGMGDVFVSAGALGGVTVPEVGCATGMATVPEFVGMTDGVVASGVGCMIGGTVVATTLGAYAASSEITAGPYHSALAMACAPASIGHQLGRAPPGR